MLAPEIQSVPLMLRKNAQKRALRWSFPTLKVFFGGAVLCLATGCYDAPGQSHDAQREAILAQVQVLAAREAPGSGLAEVYPSHIAPYRDMEVTSPAASAKQRLRALSLSESVSELSGDGDQATRDRGLLEVSRATEFRLVLSGHGHGRMNFVSARPFIVDPLSSPLQDLLYWQSAFDGQRYKLALSAADENANDEAAQIEPLGTIADIATLETISTKLRNATMQMDVDRSAGFIPPKPILLALMAQADDARIWLEMETVSEGEDEEVALPISDALQAAMADLSSALDRQMNLLSALEEASVSDLSGSVSQQYYSDLIAYQTGGVFTQDECLAQATRLRESLNREWQSLEPVVEEPVESARGATPEEIEAKRLEQEAARRAASENLRRVVLSLTGSELPFTPVFELGGDTVADLGRLDVESLPIWLDRYGEPTDTASGADIGAKDLINTAAFNLGWRGFVANHVRGTLDEMQADERRELLRDGLRRLDLIKLEYALFIDQPSDNGLIARFESLEFIAEEDRDATIVSLMSEPGLECARLAGQTRFATVFARSRAVLGQQFSIFAFRDVVWSDGSRPLDLVEDDVDAWATSGVTSP